MSDRRSRTDLPDCTAGGQCFSTPLPDDANGSSVAIHGHYLLQVVVVLIVPRGIVIGCLLFEKPVMDRDGLPWLLYRQNSFQSLSPCHMIVTMGLLPAKRAF